MNGLKHKRILLGVTGGIAAYKAAELIRLLRKAGAMVQVVMTPSATEFVTALTLQALSGNPVRQTLFDVAAEAGMGHIELARWADAVLIAPASADFIARIAQGQADDLLSTLCLALPSPTPLAIAPAMNQAMWLDETVQQNCATLLARGCHLWGPDAGEQACGDVGPGRLWAPEELVAATAALFTPQSLYGKRVLLTAGPTRESWDPVRFLSNHSSGKMGYALAEAARDAGAEVCLISGPVELSLPDSVTRISVTSALEMQAAVMAEIEQCDLFIAAAAVSDYRFQAPVTQKIKRQASRETVTLIQNPDIVAEAAAAGSGAFIVGFAAETQDEIQHGREKLRRKKLDAIVVNRVDRPGQGFHSDDNAVTLLWDDAGHLDFKLARKSQLARQLIAQLHHLMQARIPREEDHGDKI